MKKKKDMIKKQNTWKEMSLVKRGPDTRRIKRALYIWPIPACMRIEGYLADSSFYLLKNLAHTFCSFTKIPKTS